MCIRDSCSPYWKVLIVRKVTRQELHLPHLEAPPGQRVQRAVLRQVGKAQRKRAEHLPALAIALVLLRGAVFGVPQQRVADRSQMGADLMGAPGGQGDEQQREPVLAVQHLSLIHI